MTDELQITVPPVTHSFKLHTVIPPNSVLQLGLGNQATLGEADKAGPGAAGSGAGAGNGEEGEQDEVSEWSVGTEKQAVPRTVTIVPYVCIVCCRCNRPITQMQSPNHPCIHRHGIF